MTACKSWTEKIGMLEWMSLVANRLQFDKCPTDVFEEKLLEQNCTTEGKHMRKTLYTHELKN